MQKLNNLRIITIPNVNKGGFIPNFKVFCKGACFYEYNEDQGPDPDPKNQLDKKPIELIRDRS